MNDAKNGSLVTKSYYLHNTKIASSKIGEDEIKKQEKTINIHKEGVSLSLKCFIICYDIQKFILI